EDEREMQDRKTRKEDGRREKSNKSEKTERCFDGKNMVSEADSGDAKPSNFRL
ncbi:MAG: hypothetical protein Q9188_002312, partial [Gyalolechia gomerana]